MILEFTMINVWLVEFAMLSLQNYFDIFFSSSTPVTGITWSTVFRLYFKTQNKNISDLHMDS